MDLELEKRDDGKYYRKVIVEDWQEVDQEVIKENYYKASSEYEKNCNEIEDLEEEIDKRESRNQEVEPVLSSLRVIMVEEGWLPVEEDEEPEEETVEEQVEQ
jgi:hypothetical protein